VERKRGQRYSSEFRRQAVARMNACDNIVRLSQELGVARRLLYNWCERLDETSPPPQRSRELILRKQITNLKRRLANKTLEVDFFRRALQKVTRHLRRNKKKDTVARRIECRANVPVGAGEPGGFLSLFARRLAG
jgi:transposase-like protein